MKHTPIIFTLLMLSLLMSTPHALAQTEIPPNVLPVYAVQGDGIASPLLGDYVDVQKSGFLILGGRPPSRKFLNFREGPSPQISNRPLTPGAAER